MNGYTASTDPPPPLYVRALYDYDADDQTSLSFRQGDIIQVLTQLESGWWDGVINDVRGWFPSNYCTALSMHDDLGEYGISGRGESDTSAESVDEDEYEDDLDSEGNPRDEDSDLPIEGGDSSTQEEAAFWIPQATPDGRLFYFNTMTGVSKMELPLEAPTSANEMGPHDRANIRIPQHIRPPPEMMTQRAGQNDEDYDGSASEAELDSFTKLAQKKGRPFLAAGVQSEASVDFLSGKRKTRDPANTMHSFQQASISLPLNGTTGTSFSIGYGASSTATTVPQHFVDDGTSSSMTWNTLVENLQRSVEVYRQAIRQHDRAEYVRRAEDISDHVRMLLAAGSGTTDNHSGAQSIIQTNKALYPHFRDMMSRFSKLVLSTHIAATDLPGPESLAKCLQEADGVMNGVYGFVEVARRQRGEEIPRITPGFVWGADTGGNWKGNSLQTSQGLRGGRPFYQDESECSEPPSAFLDVQLVDRVDDARRLLVAAVRTLEEILILNEKIMTPARQSELGEIICQAAAALIEQFRPWINQIESINLSSLRTTMQNPQLLDFAAQKQKVYDSVGDVVASCQAVTAPLADEWAESRGESLQTRFNNVRTSCRQLEEYTTRISFSLQSLLDNISANSQRGTNHNHRLTDGGEAYQMNRLRSDPTHSANQRPHLGDIGLSHSFSVGQEPSPEKFNRPNSNNKAEQFFGQIPPTSAILAQLNTEPILINDENPWFLQLDHPNQIQYDTKSDPPQPKSGTLTGLVEQLTRHDRLDSSFNNTFLLTYRSFTTAAELFELLVRRYNLQPPAKIKRDELEIWRDRKQKLVRIRVVNILKSWFEHYWMEANDDVSHRLLQRAHAFVSSQIATVDPRGTAPLLSVIDQRLKGQDTTAKRLVLTLVNSAPPPILPKNLKKLKFLDIDATEFARQLTIVESRLYGKIKPIECLDKTWQKKPKDDNAEPAPNVKALILHSNQLTNWVAEMILQQPEVKKRVGVIKHFVIIADKCRSMNNFSTLTSIVSALGTAPILRLNRTWAQVHPKTHATLESMRQLIASTKNFGRYREQLHAANPPCIPFLGVYLTDLTFIEDGIASIMKGTDLINFAKRAKTAEVIRDIQQYQNVPYSLNPVQDLQEWIIENMRNATDVHEMYPKSLLIEPREREEEKIARLLSESGFL